MESRTLKERFVMNKNDVFEIEITGMTDEGDGVGRAEGIAVFVPYTIVGEVVRVHIIKVNKSYAIGKLLDVVRPSEHRLKSECEYFYKCGGCQLWHMDYEAELEFKHQKVADCIKRIGGIDVPVSPVIGADNLCRYRNKVQLPVSEKGIGFYRKNSHDVIDMDDCLLQTEESRELVALIREWISEYNIEPYDEKTDKGVLRHIYIRSGREGILLTLVSKEEKLPFADKLAEKLKESDIPVVGLVLNINSKPTNVVLGSKNIVLYGKGSLSDNIGDVEFEISPNSFYQVNKEQTYKLYSTALKMAELHGGETVWDLYCGIGTLGQFMAKSAAKIAGIEIVPQAVADGERNARKNEIYNAEYFCGAAEKLAPELIKKGYKPDVVILDPPRKGCDEKLLETVVRSKPKRIVYVSCKPSTLARDLKYLEEKGYKTTEIVPCDMFPRTSHVETVVLLQRQNT